MKLKALLADDDAVSPVIGVILMVAITVILAAVIGTFVLGLGNQVGNNAPQASFSFDYSGTDLTIAHNGGAAISEERLSVKFSGTGADNSDVTVGSWSSGSDVTAGDTVTATSVAGTETVRVIWTSAGGDQSAELAKWTGPDA